MATLVWPNLTVSAMVVLFGAFAIIEGLIELVGAVTGNRAGENRLLRGVRGVISIIAGVIAFARPAITALTLLYVVAAWALVIGVMEIIAAIRLRRVIEGELLLGISGVLSIAFGIIAFIFPREGSLSLTWLVAIYAMLFGVMLIALGLKIRTWSRGHGTLSPT